MLVDLGGQGRVLLICEHACVVVSSSFTGNTIRKCPEMGMHLGYSKKTKETPVTETR